ncbi:MAG: hypothetical protein VCD31_17100 [Alphaproteobacteria bacterium]
MLVRLPPCPEDRSQRWHSCFGTITFADGDKYVGEWRDDTYHGQGTYISANGGFTRRGITQTIGLAAASRTPEMPPCMLTARPAAL